MRDTNWLIYGAGMTYSVLLFIKRGFQTRYHSCVEFRMGRQRRELLRMLSRYLLKHDSDRYSETPKAIIPYEHLAIVLLCD